MMNIFDDILSNVNREIGKVQARSQEMIQAFTLNSEIRTLERKKAALLVEIAGYVVDKYQRNVEISDEALRSKTGEVVELEREIIALQAELDRLKVESSPDVSAARKSEARAGYYPTPGAACPHCQAGADLSKPFCPACGGSLKGFNNKEGDEDEAGMGLS